MPRSFARRHELLAGESVRRELKTLLEADPELEDLVQLPGTRGPAERQWIGDPKRPYELSLIEVPDRQGKLWVGPMPGVWTDRAQPHVEAIQEHGIDQIVMLMAMGLVGTLYGPPDLLEAYELFFPGRVLQLEIADHQVPADDALFEQAVEQVDQLLLQGKNVLVHCVAGCGRSGMFACCELIRAGMTPTQAIQSFIDVRGCGPETIYQVAYVVRYAQRLAKRD